MAQIDDSIIWAIKNGDLDQVKELIEQNGFDVNQEITTRSPIHYAADYGQSDVLKYLINKGADVNVSVIHFVHLFVFFWHFTFYYFIISPVKFVNSKFINWMPCYLSVSVDC